MAYPKEMDWTFDGEERESVMRCVEENKIERERAWKEFRERETVKKLTKQIEDLDLSADDAMDLEDDPTDIKRYEECLGMLLADFIDQTKQELPTTKPKGKVDDYLKVAKAANKLMWRLCGIDWRSIPRREGYLTELDKWWMKKAHFTTDEKRIQVVWEFVTGTARLWDCKLRPHQIAEEQRHHDCFKEPKGGIHLWPQSSNIRPNRYYQPNTYDRRGKRGEWEVCEFGRSTHRGPKRLWHGYRPDDRPLTLPHITMTMS